jgi:hypothetical protein
MNRVKGGVEREIVKDCSQLRLMGNVWNKVRGRKENIKINKIKTKQKIKIKSEGNNTETN